LRWTVPQVTGCLNTHTHHPTDVTPVIYHTLPTVYGYTPLDHAPHTFPFFVTPAYGCSYHLRLMLHFAQLDVRLRYVVDLIYPTHYTAWSWVDSWLPITFPLVDLGYHSYPLLFPFVTDCTTHAPLRLVGFTLRLHGLLWLSQFQLFGYPMDSTFTHTDLHGWTPLLGYYGFPCPFEPTPQVTTLHSPFTFGLVYRTVTVPVSQLCYVGFTRTLRFTHFVPVYTPPICPDGLVAITRV